MGLRDRGNLKRGRGNLKRDQGNLRRDQDRSKKGRETQTRGTDIQRGQRGKKGNGSLLSGGQKNMRGTRNLMMEGIGERLKRTEVTFSSAETVVTRMKKRTGDGRSCLRGFQIGTGDPM